MKLLVSVDLTAQYSKSIPVDGIDSTTLASVNECDMLVILL